MRNENSLYTVVAIVATVLFLLVSAFFFDWDYSQSIFSSLKDKVVLSSVISVVAFVIIGFSISYVNLRCFSYSARSVVLYGTYMMLALSVSGAFVFSQYHIAALLVIWAIMYLFKFVAYEKLKYSHLFMSMIYISTAAMLVPQLLVYLLLFIFFSFGRREYSGAKILYTIFGAVIIPWIYLFAYLFLIDGPSMGETMQLYFAEISNINPTIAGLSIHGVVYYSVVLLIMLRAMLYFRAVYSQRNRAQRVSINFSLALSVSSLVLMVLYFNPNDFMLAIPLFVPFTFSMFDYFKNGNKGEAGIAFTLLFVLTVFYRISALIG